MVVVGLGGAFPKLSEVIGERFQIVAVSDSKHNEGYSYGRWNYIPLSKLSKIEDDYQILICVYAEATYWELYNLLVYNFEVDKNIIMDPFVVQEIEIAFRRKLYKSQVLKFKKNVVEYKEKQMDRFPFVKEYQFPILSNWNSTASKINPLYTPCERWCSRHIYLRKPTMHYDIGGRVEGFINRLVTFEQNVTQIDIRPNEDYLIEGLSFKQENGITLESIEDNSIESISILQTLETYGLGRYGDPIDPNAWYIGLKSIQRVKKRGG